MKRPTHHRVIADEYLLHNWCDLNAFGARGTLRDTQEHIPMYSITILLDLDSPKESK